MASLILRRLSLLVPNVFILTFLLFVSVTTFLGSPAALMLGEDASPAAIRQIDTQFGFNRPVVVQYLSWVDRALHGNLGRSYATQEEVSAMLAPAIPVTLELSAWSVLLAVLSTSVINSLPAARRLVDTASLGLCIVGITVPNFFLGIGLIDIFSVQLGWLPSTGWAPWSSGSVEHLAHMVLPVLTLTAFYFGSFSLVYKSEYRAVAQQVFVKVARAKGLSETAVSFKHILPNAILPVITYAGLSMGQLVGGAVVTETVFSIPGVGRLLVDAIGARDFPVMLAIGIVIIVGVTVSNLVADLLYALVNPLVRRAR